jgi:gliding motility-associated-like protein
MWFLSGLLLTVLGATASAQNSMVGDGFGGRLWYRPTNYTVGSYSAFSICYTDPCDSTSNQLYGWGGDNVGELANGPGFNCTSTPAAIPGISDVQYFSTGYWMGAIKNDGTGWVWGGFDGFSAPTQVINDVKFVDASARLVSFVKNDGTVWSIGINAFGQFGNGTLISNNTTPVQMLGVSNAVRVAVGLFATHVLLADGTVVAVGSSMDGAMGVPTITIDHTTLPVPVPDLSSIVDIKAMSYSTVALNTSGEIFSWGAGGYTGDGDTDNDSIPERIEGYSNIVAISGCTDGGHIMFLDAEKNAYVYGNYNLYQTYLTPSLVSTDVVDIMAGETFSYVVKSDGTLWAAGSSLCGSIWMDQPNFIHPATNDALTQLDPSDVPGSCPLVGTLAVASATCTGGTITVNHFGGQEPYSYDIGTGPQPSNIFTDVSLGSYTVTVTDANGCVRSVPCTVATDGVAPEILDMGTVNACMDEGFMLPSGNLVFTSGTYSDTAYSTLGCDTVRLFDVVISPLPGTTFPITLCAGEAYNLPNGAEVFAPGTYLDTLVVVGGCDSVYTFSLILSTLPPVVAEVNASDTSITLGEGVLLSPSPGSNHSWFPSTGLSCTDCTLPLASPTVTTEYCVIISDNILGCGTDTACITITVSSSVAFNCTAANIFVPSAFSPDVSGKNDQQCVHGTECIATMTLGIYNRWGNQVFETTDPEACWDGTYNGQALDPAVFVYHLIATLTNGETLERQGNITLMR